MRIALVYIFTFLFSSCLLRLLRWKTQIVSRVYFWEMASCSLALKAALPWVFALPFNWSKCWIFVSTAAHCALGEILLLHTHLQRTHLLIRHDSRDWFSLLFTIQKIDRPFMESQVSLPSYAHMHYLHTNSQTWAHCCTNFHLHYVPSLLD